MKGLLSMETHARSGFTRPTSARRLHRPQVFIQPIENFPDHLTQIGRYVAGIINDQPLVFFRSAPEAEHRLSLVFGRLIEIVMAVQLEQWHARPRREVDVVD